MIVTCCSTTDRLSGERNFPGAAIEKMISTPEMQKKMQEMGLEIMPAEQRTPEYFAKFLKEDIERWAQYAKLAKIAPQ